MDFYIQDFVEDDFSEELQAVHDQVRHCRHLSIRDGAPEFLSAALEYLSYAAAPVLSSINFSVYHDLKEDFSFKEPLFSLNTPHLAIAQIDTMGPSSIPACVSGLQYETYWRLAGIIVDNALRCDLHHPHFRDALVLAITKSPQASARQLQRAKYPLVRGSADMTIPTYTRQHHRGFNS